jgi:hypothetical protein
MSTTKVSAVMQNAGAIVQVVNVADSAVATGTTTLPNDDTIPQKTEGDQYFTLAITPKNSSNRLIITAWANAASSQTGVNQFCMALFQDTTANCLTVTDHIMMDSAGLKTPLYLQHEMAAGTTSSTTFKIRLGTASAGTTTFNGVAGSRFYGGTMNSGMSIMEIQV